MRNLNIAIDDLFKDDLNKMTLSGVPAGSIIQSLCVDSRKVQKGDWFLCLRGESFDGHDFIEMALSSGAVGIIYDRADLHCKGIKVPDTTRFLGILGKHWRKKVNPIVIAVTGSNGKTSVKELLSFLLDKIAPGKICQSSGNFNNQFGVPYTLLSLSPHHKYLVIEIGTNHPGEIAPLSDFALPDYAVITSVSPGHIGNFGSLESIVAEKSEVISGMKPNGILFVNSNLAQNPLVQSRAARQHIQIKSPDDSLVLSRSGDDGMELILNQETFHFPVCGHHQFQNLLLVYTLIKEIFPEGELLKNALRQLKGYRPIKGRLQKIKNDSYNVWDDTYNANPASFEEAVKFVSQFTPMSQVFGAFGMMGELGDFSEEAHEKLGEFTAESGFTSVFFSAPDEKIRKAFLKGWQKSSRNLSKDPSAGATIQWAGNSDEDIYSGYNYLLNQMRKGDHLLVKGSRSAKMERILKYFIG